jgi:O-antigen/teichoic acid export membrane protein
VIGPRRRFARGTAPRVMNRSVGWGLVDQGLNSGSNFLLGIVIARSTSAHDFGTFSVIYVLYMLALGACRSITYEPLTVHYSGTVATVAGKAARACVVVTLISGVVMGSMLVASGGVLRGTAGPLLVTMGVALPFLLLQETIRGVCFASERPGAAAVSDTIWIVAQMIGFAAVFVLVENPPAWALLAVWTASGSVAGIATCAWVRAAPVGSPRRWIRDHSSLIVASIANFAFRVAPPYLVYALLPIVGGLEALGRLRAAYLVFGPLGVVFEGAVLAALPTAVVAARRGDALRPLARRFSAALTVLALGWGALIVLVPDTLGRLLLGDGWSDASSTRAVLAFSLAAEGMLVGAAIALRASGSQARLARARLLAGPVTIISSLARAVPFGAPGAAAGFVIGDSTVSIGAWRALRRQGLDDTAAATDDSHALALQIQGGA